MKKTTFTVLTILASGLIFTSCSKCYECTTEHEVEVITPDTNYVTVETSSEDYCSSSSEEVAQKEADEGAVCTVI